MTTFETLITVLLMIPCFVCARCAGAIAGDLASQTQPPEIRTRLTRSQLFFGFGGVVYGITAALYLAQIICP